MRLTARDLLGVKHLEFRNSSALGGKKITGVSTDSRTLKAGNLFFALKGGNFDGHAFVDQAFGRGAVAAVVNASARDSLQPSHPLLVVEDTTRALGELAHIYRMGFTIPVLAIGGSNGKTTTKEMVTRVLRMNYNVLSTEGNLNNHVGVPLTLFKLQKRHDIAVVEIGTNHPGEIAHLCTILEPTHGLITNIGKEHLEFFGSVQGVAREEGVLFAALRNKKGSVAFVNGDDALLVELSKGNKKRFTYGLSAKRLAVKGSVVGYNRSGCPRLHIVARGKQSPTRIQMRVPGEPNAMNALAAAAVGIAFDVPLRKIGTALESFRAASKRMEVVRMKGVTVFNDTYNANPDSTRAALRTLARVSVSGKKIAVLADMLELGDHAPAEHAQVGKEVSRLGLDYLLTYGSLAKHIHDEAHMSGAIHYEQKNMLAEYLAELVSPGDAVLIKGSRGMRMEDVVTFLEQRLESRTR